MFLKIEAPVLVFIANKMMGGNEDLIVKNNIFTLKKNN